MFRHVSNSVSPWTFLLRLQREREKEWEEMFCIFLLSSRLEKYFAPNLFLLLYCNSRIPTSRLIDVGKGSRVVRLGRVLTLNKAELVLFPAYPRHCWLSFLSEEVKKISPKGRKKPVVQFTFLSGSLPLFFLSKTQCTMGTVWCRPLLYSSRLPRGLSSKSFRPPCPSPLLIRPNPNIPLRPCVAA